MHALNPLDELQVASIRDLAEEKRRSLGYVGSPIAGSIFTILDRLNITLLQLPIESSSTRPAFSAAILYSRVDGEELAFIGLNTADYFDKQIFAIAHELYHFFTKTKSHLSQIDEEADPIEASANRFAAEFLLPESELSRFVRTEFGMSSLNTVAVKKLLRFIARLQCTWWLPYRSLVKRLKEIDAISEGQYDELYSVDERCMDGDYARIGMATDAAVFSRLNTITKETGASQKSIEVIVQNYEDNLIDDDQFAAALHLFGRRPSDFGYDFGVAEADLRELGGLFRDEG